MSGSQVSGGDILVTWDNANARGDWSIANGGLALGNPLLSAVMVSLFTDRVAPVTPTSADQAAGIGTPTQLGSSGGSGATGAGTTNRRGWWGDAFAAYPIGSRLWQLRRAVKTNVRGIPQDAEDMCTEALQWLLDDDVVASLSVTATWATATALQLAITLLEPAATSPQVFKFQFAWSGL